MSTPSGKRRAPPHAWKPGQSGNPVGRAPRVLTPAELRRVEALAAKGFHEVTLAAVLGMSSPAWVARKRDTVALVEAIERGRARYHDFHVAILNRFAAKGAWVASLATLKSRFGWREGDTPADQRPTIIINMPGAAPSLDSYRQQMIDVTPAIDAHDD